MSNETIVAKGFLIIPRLKIENPRDKMLFLFLFERANFADDKLCKRGELITSKKQLEELTGWTYGIIRGAISRLEGHGLIVAETLSQKRGTKIRINNYSFFQDLTNYKTDSSFLRYEDSKQDNKQYQHPNNKQSNAENPELQGNTDPYEVTDNKEDTKKDNKRANKEKCNTITEFLNSISEQNVYNKKENCLFLELVEKYSIGHLLFYNKDEIANFVDFAADINSLILNIDRLILMDYLNIVRLARSSKKVSLRVIAKFLDDVLNYPIKTVESALRVHLQNHPDKIEAYTIGIIKNMADQNINVQKEKHFQKKGPSKSREREARLRAKGYLANTGDVQFDY
ncbi:hypothetical protein [Virgibacillus oceani]|uniref:Uncharacterized protein n=1 Tax=Virgibacillus oceani TaxID=1479511 RepID=A0A917GY80_9BACI|nr:hypothetical protein [Virgibacillus oceani]GGG61076.1 hypothetical protein GCM10011398_00420 [Virgibacillus oceani]